jgi:hypothetical protein
MGPRCPGSLDDLLLGVNLVKAVAVGKVLLVGLFSAAKGLVNGEELDLGELVGVLGFGFVGHRRAVEVFACNVLAFFAVQVLQVFLRHSACAFLSTFLSTTATVGSAKMLKEGATTPNLELNSFFRK